MTAAPAEQDATAAAGAGTPALDSDLALVAQFFEKPGGYEQLHHRHGAPTEIADDIALVRYAKESGRRANSTCGNRVACAKRGHQLLSHLATPVLSHRK